MSKACPCGLLGCLAIRHSQRACLLRLQRALIVRLVLRVNWWQVLEEVEVSSVARDDSERLM